MTTVRQIVTAAVRQLGINNLQASKLGECREALNTMLIEWAMMPSGIYAATRENFTLVSGTAEYTIGSGATLNTTRPVNIVKAFVRVSSTDYMLSLVSLQEYGSISIKSTSGQPQALYHERGHTTDTILLWPTPDSAYDLHLWSHKPLGTYTSLDDSLNLPPEYEPAIKYNLALVVAPELAVQPYPSTVAMATKSFKALRNMNMNPVPKLITNPFSGPYSFGDFDIDEG